MARYDEKLKELQKPRTVLDQWIDFLASKPADEAYPLDDPHNCAMGQFVATGAATYQQSGDGDFCTNGLEGMRAWNSWYIAGGNLEPGDHTFGRALSRALKVRARHD